MPQMTKKELMKHAVEFATAKGMDPDAIYKFAVISANVTRQGNGLTYIQIADIIKDVTGQEVNPDDVQMSNERL